MRKNFLAFDLGASSGRGIIGSIENDKIELNEIHRFANGPMDKHGELFWDFPGLVEELKTGIRKALEQTRDICAIGVDTWGVDYVLFKRNTKEMIRLPNNYRDHRTDKMPEKVFQKISQNDLYGRTGMQFMQINTLYQLVAHYQLHPEDFEDSVLLLIPDALEYMLGGEATCEYTNASTTNLLNPHTRNWDFELIDLLGLPRSIFPKIVEPCTKGGCLSEELQKEFNCGPIPIVKVGSHDTASAVAAVPAEKDRSWAYISCGTWALLGAEINQPILTKAAEQAPFTNEGGLNHTIRFLTNIMGSWLFQEVRRVWNENGANISFGQMEKMASEAEGMRYLINPNDGMFLTPGDMPGKISDFCALTNQGSVNSNGAVLRAIYDSLALCFRNKLENLQEILGVKYDSLHVVGGGVKDGQLLQFTADALGIPIIGGPIEATATGNIVAQALAMGVIKNLDAAREIVKNSTELKIFQPRKEFKAQYDAAMERFEKLCQTKVK